jgi:hypothetical protein
MATEAKGSGLWSWLRDETNRKVIAWLGSGIVVVSSGLWVAYEKFNPVAKKASAPAPTSSVVVYGGAIMAGRDVNQVTSARKHAEESAKGPPAAAENGAISSDVDAAGGDVNRGVVAFPD